MPEYYGVAKHNPRRLMADGKHSLEVSKTEHTITLRCKGEGCDWWTRGLRVNEDMVQESGWLHISEPDLLVSGSSDISKAVRLAVMNADKKR